MMPSESIRAYVHHNYAYSKIQQKNAIIQKVREIPTELKDKNVRFSTSLMAFGQILGNC